jgi:hypothetical protein
VDSPEGQLVLYLARTLDGGGIADTAKAALSARLMAAHERATYGAPVEPDALDEIAKRRRAKIVASE